MPASWSGCVKPAAVGRAARHAAKCGAVFPSEGRSAFWVEACLGGGRVFPKRHFLECRFRKMFRSHAAPPARVPPPLSPPRSSAAAQSECHLPLSSPRRGAARVPPPLSPPRSSAAAQSECHLPLSSPRRGPARVPPPLSPLRSSAVAGPSNPLSSLRSNAAAWPGKEKFADSKGFAIFAHNSLKSVYDYGKFERPEEGD